MDITISTINKQSSYTQSDNANRDLKTVSFTYLLATYVAISRFPQNWSHLIIYLIITHELCNTYFLPASNIDIIAAVIVLVIVLLFPCS